MSEALQFQDTATPETVTVGPPDESVDGSVGKMDAGSARQAAIAALSKKSIAATDIPSLGLDAARLAARICDVDGYSFAERQAGTSTVAFRIGQLTDESTAEYELDMDGADSLTAYALTVGKPVIITNLSKDRRCRDRLLRKHKIVSAVVCPLSHADGPLGTIGVYSPRRHKFSPPDVYFIESLANLIAISFARRAAEEIVAQQNKRMTALLKSSKTPTLELTPQGLIISCNPELERLTGFELDELADRSVYSAFILPEELETVQHTLAAAKENADCARVECFLLTKDGKRRRLIWSFTRVTDDSENVISLLGTAVDVNEQLELAERLRQAESMADSALKSLRDLRARAARETQSRSGVAPQQLSGRERREQVRRIFPFKQYIAPVRGERLPGPEKFEEIRCHDISSRGFSFHAPEIPDYQRLLVAFGKEGIMNYLTAEVCHATPAQKDDEQMFLVGCRYTGRVSKDDLGR